jgi:hypothetical protein
VLSGRFSLVDSLVDDRGIVLSPGSLAPVVMGVGVALLAARR